MRSASGQNEAAESSHAGGYFFSKDHGHFCRSGDLVLGEHPPERKTTNMTRTNVKPTPTSTQKPAQLVVRSNVKAGGVWWAN
jgi:hypothetical protein